MEQATWLTHTKCGVCYETMGVQMCDRHLKNTLAGERLCASCMLSAPLYLLDYVRIKR